jgi:hypothetical protein
MRLTTLQRKHARKLGALAVQIMDDRRAASDRKREKQSLLHDAELRCAKITARKAQIEAEQFVTREKKREYLAEAAEDLADSENICADLRDEIARLDTLIEQLNEDARPAQKFAERIMAALGMKHEDFPEIGIAVGSLRAPSMGETQ